jgi:hypothetical protein
MSMNQMNPYARAAVDAAVMNVLMNVLVRRNPRKSMSLCLDLKTMPLPCPMLCRESLDPTMPVYTTVDGRRHADMRHMALPQIRQWAQNLSYDAYMRHKDMPFILPDGIKSKDDVLRVMNPPKPKSSVMNMFKDMIGMKSG